MQKRRGLRHALKGGELREQLIHPLRRPLPSYLRLAVLPLGGYNSLTLASLSIVFRLPVSPSSSSRSAIASQRLLQVNCFHSLLLHWWLTVNAQITRAFSTGTAVARMPPVTKPGHEKYDIVFIGGGSGGVAGSVSCVLAFICVLPVVPDWRNPCKRARLAHSVHSSGTRRRGSPSMFPLHAWML